MDESIKKTIIQCVGNSLGAIDYIELENRYGISIYPKRNCVIVNGSGARVVDSTGKEYIDCVGGHGVASVGHANSLVIEAIKKQAERLTVCSGTFYNDKRALLMEKLVGLAPSSIKRVYLCNSGAEAIEAAIKFARFSTGKKEFICASRGFHGRTMGALSATHNPAYKEEFQPLVPGFHFVPFNKIAELQAVVETHPDIAGIILEPVQGEGGVNIGNVDYFKQVRELCTCKNILFIADEVQTGFCRTGKMFGIEHFDVEPDMMCFAKAVAGGIPMGGVLCSDKIAMVPGKHGSTFGGNPFSCAAALGAIEFMQEQRLDIQAAEKGEFLLRKLNEISSPRIRDIRGMGLMIGIELKEKVKPIIEELMNRGVLALPAGTTVLRLLPPLVIEYDDLEIVVSEIKNILN